MRLVFNPITGNFDYVASTAADVNLAGLATNITAGKTLTLVATNDYSLTVPATGVAALLATANVFTAAQKINVNSTTALLVEQDGVKDNILVVDTTNGFVGVGLQPTVDLDITGAATNPTLRIHHASNGRATILKFSGAAGTWDIRQQNNSVSGALQILAGTTQVMNMSRTGLVNIGNAGIVASALLHVGASYSDANRLYSAAAAAIIESSDGILQFIGNDTSSGAAAFVMSAVPAAGNNKIWGMMAKGPTNNNRFAIGYIESSSTAFYDTLVDNSYEWLSITKTGLIGIGTYADPSAQLHIIARTTTTNAVQEVSRIEAVVSTPATGGANGFGAAISYWLESATDGASKQAARIAAVTVDATAATYTSQLNMSAYYQTTERNGLNIIATSSDVYMLALGKIAFTQVDGNEFIDSLADGYMDYRATTGHRFGDGTNYLQISAAGHVTLTGTATVFEDINFDPDSSGGPAVTLPDYVVINNVIHREFTSLNNQLCGDGEELPHTYKLSSTVYPHIHLFLKSGESAGTTGVTFTFYWELRQSTGATSGSVTLAATTAELGTTAGANKFTVYDSTGFAGAAELGAQLTIKIARTAGDAGDIIVTTYGVHYEADTLGSNTIDTK